MSNVENKNWIWKAEQGTEEQLSAKGQEGRQLLDSDQEDSPPIFVEVSVWIFNNSKYSFPLIFHLSLLLPTKSYSTLHFEELIFFKIKTPTSIQLT